MSPSSDSEKKTENHATVSPADAGLSLSGVSRPAATEEPIAALCTAPGRGAIAVIRISGFHLQTSLQRVLPKLSWQPAEVRKMQLGPVVDSTSGAVLDDALSCFFQAPHSFTGEDTVEIYCHGGTYVVQKILQSLLAAGCRQALPGEFTQRAFLNGKLDLTAAEGIRELIEAQSDQQWKAARHLVSGKLATAIEELRASLIEASAYLEAQIDFPDEGDTSHLQLSAVDQRVAVVESKLKALQSTYASGRVARSGLKVAILGLPNMGKSTLLNTLLQQERAIVTDIAGTTRDYLEESCLIKGRLVRLIDTAGLRETDDVVEKKGVDRAFALAEQADLVLLLMAADVDPNDEAYAYWSEWVSRLPAERCLRVLSKVDQALPDTQNPAHFDVAISCQTGEGLEELQDRIATAVFEHLPDPDLELIISHPRHLQAIEQTLAALQSYHQGRQDEVYEEMLAFELQRAMESLEAVIGRVDHEDVLDKIFGDFCVGK